MKGKKLFFVLLLIQGFSKVATAQDRWYFAENASRIDSLVEDRISKGMCDEKLRNSTTYKNRKARSDSFIPLFINYTTGFYHTRMEIEKKLNAIHSKRSFSVEETKGLIKTKRILLKGNYIRAEMLLVFIDSLLIRYELAVRTVTHANCYPYYTNMLDFQLVKNHFLPYADQRFYFNDDEMRAEAISPVNLQVAADRRKDYQFNIPGSAGEPWIDSLFMNQYKDELSWAYNYEETPEQYLRLIHEEKYPVLSHLLYSPNYITSINAMEALIYCNSIHKVVLNDTLLKKIKEIKEDTVMILQQGAPDVLYTRKGYGELGTTDSRVINKYESSLKRYLRRKS